LGNIGNLGVNVGL